MHTFLVVFSFSRHIHSTMADHMVFTFRLSVFGQLEPCRDETNTYPTGQVSRVKGHEKVIRGQC